MNLLNATESCTLNGAFSNICICNHDFLKNAYCDDALPQRLGVICTYDAN